MARSFPFYHQLDVRDCGPTCLRMIATWHGTEVPLVVLRDRAEVDREGATLLGLAAAAESIGMEATAVQVPLRGDPGLTDAPLPCILHWKQNHFVVLYRISGSYFYLADPAKGRYRLREKRFLQHWMAGDREGIALLLEPGPDFGTETFPPGERTGWRFLWQYLRPYRSLWRQLLLGLLAMSVIQLIIPFLTRALVDLGIGNRDIGLIWILLVGQLVLFFGQTSALFFQNWIFLHLGSRFNLSLLFTFLRKLMELPLRYFDRRLMGDLLNRIQDHRRIEQFVTQASLSLLLALVQLLLFGIVLALFHWGIALLFFVSTALYFAWFVWFWEQRQVVDAERFEKMSENQQVLVELIRGMPEIKLQGSGRKRRRQWAQIQADLYRVNLRGLRIAQWQDGGTTLIAQVKDVAILLVAALAVIEGRMSLGTLLAIQFIVGQLNVPLRQIVTFLRRAQDARISLDRFGEIHSLPGEEQGRSGPPIAPDNQPPTVRSLRGEGLSFSYSSFHPAVLHELDFHIPEGKVTAIVGSSGSGKTTLLKILLGFYGPDSGILSLGDVPLENYRRDWWRRQCGAVLQDGFIFSDTLANNIAESTERIDADRLQRAVHLADLEVFVRSLPNGLQTTIGDRGMGLSQGQRQRVLIARAVYRDPPFLFFDEATNALDAGTEARIMQRMRTFYRGRTVVVVAHRLSTVMDADQILLLQDGRIAERGTHAQLVEQKGAYYELVRNQLDINP